MLTAVKVISYNLRKNRAVTELVNLAEHFTPNVLCLQEADTSALPTEIGALHLADSTSRNRLGLALYYSRERFTAVEWDGGASQSFRVHIAVTSWDRPRLLEDVARTFAEHGAKIVEYGGHVEDQMAKNWYVAEVGDIKALRALLTALRNVESVFDAFRVTPN